MIRGQEFCSDIAWKSEKIVKCICLEDTVGESRGFVRGRVGDKKTAWFAGFGGVCAALDDPRWICTHYLNVSPRGTHSDIKWSRGPVGAHPPSCAHAIWKTWRCREEF